MSLTGDYGFLKQNNKCLSFIGGVKFPTGQTGIKNSAGEKFEPELQPGTGSYDYTTGLVYKQALKRMDFLWNAVYVFRTQGAQEFTFGNSFSTAMSAFYFFNPKSASFRTKIGLDANLQIIKKQISDGTKVEDSGGTTLFLGPELSVETNKGVSFFFTVLPPVYQHLGGVHQRLDFAWTAGGKMVW